MKFLTTSLVALALIGATPAFAHDEHDHTADIVRVGDIEITGAFTRATLPNQPVGGGYLTITNTGDTADTLVSGSVDFAERLEIHEMAVVNDVMNMRHLPDGLVIDAGETVTLEPGGYHLMFMQMQAPLVEGEPVPVTLEFANAGSVEVEFAVAAAGAREMPTDCEHSSDHGAH